MKNPLSWRVIKLAVIGAASFWLPDLVWQLVRGDRFDRFDVLGVTIVMPAALFATFLLSRRANRATSQTFRAWPLMLGVWELGGYFMLLSATLQHSGFRNVHGWRDVLMSVVLPLIPIYTFIMATYDGSLGALIIVSIAAFFIFFIGLYRRPSGDALNSSPTKPLRG
jgi:hypothetical protein